MKHNSLESSTPAASTIHMSLRLQLEYWKDGSWFVGRLPQVPGVFSQGTTLEELEENIRDAYRMMLDEQESGPVAAGAI
jgi:predicted RNase H-like HicB family nuclease